MAKSKFVQWVERSIVNITAEDVGDITSIGEAAFSGCSGLTNVTIPDSVMLIGNSAFYGCTSLGEITIPDTVTEIKAYTFGAGVKSVTIPDSVTSIADYAFYGCTGLKSVTIPDSVESIGDYAFYGCTGLEELTMPASAKIYNSSDTFSNCTNIEKVTLTKGTGIMQDYGSSTATSSPDTHFGYTPWYISKCAEVVIEDGVTSVGAEAFKLCRNLEAVGHDIDNITATLLKRGTEIEFGNNILKISEILFHQRLIKTVFSLKSSLCGRCLCLFTCERITGNCLHCEECYCNNNPHSEKSKTYSL